MAREASVNKELDVTIKAYLKEAKGSGDMKDMAAAIGLAIKWEAVKAKLSENDYGGHFMEDGEDESDSGTSA